MSGYNLDIDKGQEFLPDDHYEKYVKKTIAAAESVFNKTCSGNDFLGWLDLPSKTDLEIDATAKRLRELGEICVTVGIGGSYLGAEAVLQALTDDTTGPEMLFAGTNLCAAGTIRLLDKIKDKDFTVIMISKSGTTLEPAIAFRLLWAELQNRYGDEAGQRVVAITDQESGALRKRADANNWQTFSIPQNVGGRFSVLCPVGLLPLAVAGIDIEKILRGADSMRKMCQEPNDDNPAICYAAIRNALYDSGFTTEILSTFHGDLRGVQEWWKQLYGESEGKQGKGIFPASAGFTTDLHSLGQYIQDGKRNLFETFLHIEHTGFLAVPSDETDPDGLEYLSGRTLDDINQKAYAGTRKAHHDGGVPTIELSVDELTPGSVGGLIYFFELACAISGVTLGVNPFDQPGVEAYKKEMFTLLKR